MIEVIVKRVMHSGFDFIGFVSLQRHAALVDVEHTSVQPLSIDQNAWAFFGYGAAAQNKQISEPVEEYS